MSLSISDFRMAIGTTNVTEAEYLKLDNGSLSTAKDKPEAAKPNTENARTALFDALSKLSADTVFKNTLTQLIYGKDGANKDAALSKLEARNIIDHAEAISGRCAQRIGRVLLSGSFPEGVSKMIEKAVVNQANNPVVRDFLEGKGNGLLGLARIARLAQSVLGATELSHADRCAVAYLDGFAGGFGITEVEKVAVNPLVDAEGREIEQAKMDGAEFANKQKTELAALKDKVLKGEGSLDDFKNLLDHIEIPEGVDLKDDKSQIQGEKSVTFKLPKKGETKFAQHENTGAGNNCLFYSVLHKILGATGATKENAIRLRLLCADLVGQLKQDSKNVSKLSDEQLSKLAPLLGTKDKGGLDNAQQVDVACVALLAHLTRTPITLVTSENAMKDGDERLVNSFNTDVLTGKSLLDAEAEKKSMIYIHYQQGEIKTDTNAKTTANGHFTVLDPVV